MRLSRGILSAAMRIAAAAVFVLALALRDGVSVALACVALGLLIVAVAWRNKAETLPDALYSASADLLPPGTGRFPGQLSVTADVIAWMPSTYSLRKGQSPISVDRVTQPTVELRAGPALLDATLVVTLRSGGSLSFQTHQSRRLHQAVAAFKRDEV